MKKEVIFSKRVPLPGWQYSQALKVGDFIFTSGQTARDSKTGEILYPGNIEAQTDIILKNIEILLKEKGAFLSDVIKSSVFIDDHQKFKLFNNAYKKFFPNNPPVRTTIAIGNFEKGMCIEIDVVAIVSGS